MPAINPEAISNLIRLSNEFAALVRPFVSEHCTVDPLLPAVVLELPPHKAGISGLGSQHNLVAWSDEQLSHSSVPVSVGRVVPLVEVKAVCISVLGQPPMPHNFTVERDLSQAALRALAPGRSPRSYASWNRLLYATEVNQLLPR